MTICDNCAKEKALVPKDKVVGVWMGVCNTCGEEKAVCDEHHDYEHNKE